jgi:quaternary ammonium compound-resistance protein SugE
VWRVARCRCYGRSAPPKHGVVADLPVGTGYAVWTGIGAIGAEIVGVVWLHESASPARLLSVALVAAGVVGLALTSQTH